MDTCNRCQTHSDDLPPGNHLRELNRFADEGGFATETVCAGCCTKIELAVIAHVEDPIALSAFRPRSRGRSSCGLCSQYEMLKRGVPNTPSEM